MVRQTKAETQSTNVTVQCIGVQQNQREFFLTKLTASVLTQISYAAVRRIDDEDGAIQRILDPKRIMDLKAFVLSGGDYPSCIILNWVGTGADQLAVNHGRLTFNIKERLAQQVDGQHRVEGLRAAIKERPAVASVEIPVVIYQGLDTRACADIFLSINAKQRPVARSLVTDLFAVASDYIVDPGAQRARDIADAMDTENDSPYFGLIKYPNSPRVKSGVPISTVVDNIKPLVEKGGILPSAGLIELNMQQACIRNFFHVLKDWYGENWLSKSNPFLSAAGFVGAIGFFKETVVPYCNLTKDFRIKHIADAMELDSHDTITRDQLKGKQGRTSWNEVISLLREKWVAGSQGTNSIKY